MVCSARDDHNKPAPCLASHAAVANHANNSHLVLVQVQHRTSNICGGVQDGCKVEGVVICNGCAHTTLVLFARYAPHSSVWPLLLTHIESRWQQPIKAGPYTTPDNASESAAPPPPFARERSPLPLHTRNIATEVHLSICFACALGLPEPACTFTLHQGPVLPSHVSTVTCKEGPSIQCSAQAAPVTVLQHQRHLGAAAQQSTEHVTLRIQGRHCHDQHTGSDLQASSVASMQNNN